MRLIRLVHLMNHSPTLNIKRLHVDSINFRISVMNRSSSSVCHGKGKVFPVPQSKIYQPYLPGAAHRPIPYSLYVCPDLFSQSRIWHYYNPATCHSSQRLAFFSCISIGYSKINSEPCILLSCFFFVFIIHTHIGPKSHLVT